MPWATIYHAAFQMQERPASPFLYDFPCYWWDLHAFINTDVTFTDLTLCLKHLTEESIE